MFRLAGAITNTVVYFNLDAAGSNVNTAVGFAYSCAPELTSGSGNTPADPQFKDSGTGYGLGFTNGVYVLRTGSPCVNTGTNLGWMAGAIDLAGNNRLRGIADMGAYEAPPPKGALFIVR